MPGGTRCASHGVCSPPLGVLRLEGRFPPGGCACRLDAMETLDSAGGASPGRDCSAGRCLPALLGVGPRWDGRGTQRGDEVREAKPRHALTGGCAGTRPQTVDHPRTQPPPYLPWRVLALPGGGCVGDRAARPTQHGAPGAGGLRIVARGSASSTSLPLEVGVGTRSVRRGAHSPFDHSRAWGCLTFFARRRGARREARACSTGGLFSPTRGPVTGGTGT